MRSFGPFVVFDMLYKRANKSPCARRGTRLTISNFWFVETREIDVEIADIVTTKATTVSARKDYEQDESSFGIGPQNLKRSAGETDEIGEDE